jgi:ribosomal protein S1
MAGSLHCSHVPWTNDPVEHNDHLKGKEEVPAVIMEVVSDY